MGNSPVAGDKRKRTQLTLHSLPQEVVLSIVEWTAQIALEDQLEQERLEHDRHHEQHHHHDHHHVPGPLGHDGPPPGPGLFAGLFGGGGFPDENANADAPGDPQGIGDVPFMQNLFGMFGNGGLPVNLPAVVPPPPPVIVPAAVPPVASNTQNNQDADDTDDEMPRKDFHA